MTSRPGRPAHASLLPIGTAESVASECQTALRRGYPAIKLHETAQSIVFAARQAIGAGVPLMVDMNCPLTGAAAIAFAQPCRVASPSFTERPVWPAETFALLEEGPSTGGVA